MNITIQTKILLAHQLIENPNEINTNDWVKLCFLEGDREELGAPNCNTQTESGSAPECICPAETEMNFWEVVMLARQGCQKQGLEIICASVPKIKHVHVVCAGTDMKIDSGSPD